MPIMGLLLEVKFILIILIVEEMQLLPDPAQSSNSSGIYVEYIEIIIYFNFEKKTKTFET